MVFRPSVLCPVDFSEASRGALRYAAAISEHFYAVLTVLTVDDPVLSDAARAAFGRTWMSSHTTENLEQFFKSTFGDHKPNLPYLRLEVRRGQPAAEIRRVALRDNVDLLVMSTHGATGARHVPYGSTTERVLRETSVPVLITPAVDPGPASVDDVARTLRTVLAPVDLSAATDRQMQIARGLAEAVDAKLVMVHVLPPVQAHMHETALLSRLDTDRRAAAMRALNKLRASVRPCLPSEIVLTEGDAAAEIVRVAGEQNADVVVMGLHASPGLGPRMGSVTYRVLCHTSVVVLALPPAVDVVAEEKVSGTFSELVPVT